MSCQVTWLVPELTALTTVLDQLMLTVLTKSMSLTYSLEKIIMRRRQLGGSDLEVSPIGLGCMQFAATGMAARFYPTPDADAVGATVKAALDGGVNWFDTAEMYGHGESERALSTALRGSGVSPGEVVVATKWAPFGRTASNIGRTVGKRIDALQGYPIDLYQIHQPISFSSTGSEMREMAKLLRARKIRAVGVSNFSAATMRRASAALAAQGLVLASNQVQISLLRRNIERDGVLAAARELGVTLIAYSPLRSGMLTGRFHDDPTLVGSLPRFRRFAGSFTERGLAATRPLIDELGAIAKSYGVSRAQVSLNWVTNYYGDMVVAIPGASKPHQAEESARSMDFQLTEQELAKLADLAV
jgi:aryl-alcohol dehydrogenase-like predicted oxidoreductase